MYSARSDLSETLLYACTFLNQIKLLPTYSRFTTQLWILLLYGRGHHIPSDEQSAHYLCKRRNNSDRSVVPITSLARLGPVWYSDRSHYLFHITPVITRADGGTITVPTTWLLMTRAAAAVPPFRRAPSICLSIIKAGQSRRSTTPVNLQGTGVPH